MICVCVTCVLFSLQVIHTVCVKIYQQLTPCMVTMLFVVRSYFYNQSAAQVNDGRLDIHHYD